MRNLPLPHLCDFVPYIWRLFITQITRPCWRATFRRNVLREHSIRVCVVHCIIRIEPEKQPLGRHGPELVGSLWPRSASTRVQLSPPELAAYPHRTHPAGEAMSRRRCTGTRQILQYILLDSRQVLPLTRCTVVGRVPRSSIWSCNVNAITPLSFVQWVG